MKPERDDVGLTNYECPVCGLGIARDVSIFLSHGKQHIFEIIRREHPEWASSDKTSIECEKYYEKQFHGWNIEKGPGNDQKVEKSV